MASTFPLQGLGLNVCEKKTYLMIQYNNNNNNLITSRALFTFTDHQCLTTLKNYNKIQIFKTNYMYMNINNVF